MKAKNKFLGMGGLSTMIADDLIEKAKDQRKRGRHDEALVSANSATQLEPARAEAWWQVAINMIDVVGTREALPALNKTVELAPHFAYGWTRRSQILLEIGKAAEAKAGFETAVALDESDTEALIALAQMYEAEKDVEGELRVLTALEPQISLSSYALNRLGILHYNKGSYAAAITYYKRCAAENKGPSGLFNLALVYDTNEISQGADAVDTWRLVAKRHPDYARSATAIEGALPKLLELRLRVRGANLNLLDREEWFANYVSPLELLNIDRDVGLDDLNARVLQKAKKALLHEIDLEDGQIAWLPGIQLDRSRAIGLSDELNNPTLLAYHHHVFRSKQLLSFLTRGDLEHFLVDPKVSPLETIELIETDPDGFLAWLSGPFASQFELVFSKAVERRKLHAVECMLDGRRWVAPAFGDLCFEGAHRHVATLIQPLRDAAGMAATHKPTPDALRLVLESDNLAAILGLLPTNFHSEQAEASTLIRDMSVAAYNVHGDADLALAILKFSEGIAYKSAALTHRLAEDTDALNERIVEERKNEAKLSFGDTAAYITKEGARHGATFIPAAEVAAVRWGTIGNGTQCDFSIVVTSDSGMTVRIAWSPKTDQEAQHKLFSSLVQAAISYLVPTAIEKFKVQLNRGVRLRVGSVIVSTAGIEVQVSGWFSTKAVLVPWARVHSEFSNGDLVIGDEQSEKARTRLPLHQTDNAVILHFVAQQSLQN